MAAITANHLTLPATIDADTFENVFPFNFILNDELEIVGCGRSLKRIHGGPLIGHFGDLFSIDRPHGLGIDHAIRLGVSTLLLVRHKKSGCRLRGGFARTADGSGYAFLGTLWVNDPAELKSLGLGVENFATHDSIVDLLTILEAHQAAAADLKTMLERLRNQRKQLQESNDQLAILSLVAAKTDNAAYVADSDWRIVWVNAGFERLTGYSSEEAVGKTPRELLHGRDTDEETVKAILDAVEEGRHYGAVLRHYRRDGSPFWGEVETQPVLGPDGKAVHFVSIERDVSDVRASEQTMRRTESILRALAIMSRELFAQVDWRSALNSAFPNLGRAAEADGVFAASFSVHEGKPSRGVEACWLRDSPRQTHGAWVNTLLDQTHDWKGGLQKEDPVQIHGVCVHEVGDGLGSLTLLPVFLYGALWGTLGFFSAGEKVVRSGPEIEALTTAAHVLAAAIERSDRSRIVGETNAKLELALEGGGLATCVLHPELKTMEFDERAARVLGRHAAEGYLSVDEFDSWIHPEEIFNYRLTLSMVITGNLDRLDSTLRLKRDDGAYRWVRMCARAARKGARDIGGVIYGTFEEVHDQVLTEIKLRRTVDELADARRKATEAAAMVQRELLVRRPPQRLGRFDITAFSIPSKGADGDFFDVFEISENIVDVLVGDVMGKGLTASLVGAGFKAQISRTLGLLATTGSIPTAAQIMQAVHDRMGGHLRTLETFTTLAYARIDATLGKIELIDCGHTRTAIWRKRTGKVDFVAGENLPVGIISGEYYRPVHIDIEPGDLVVLYSDGVTDHEIDGVPLQEERLGALIREAAGFHPETPWIAVEEALRALVEGNPPKDDFTCALVAVPERSADASRHRIRMDSSLDRIDEIRQFVAASLQRSKINWTDMDLFRFELAAVEVLTNIVNHAHSGRDEEFLSVDAEDKMGGLELRFSYSGEPFDDGEAPGDEEILLLESGYGLNVIRQSMDRVESYQDDRGTMWISLWKAGNKA